MAFAKMAGALPTIRCTCTPAAEKAGQKIAVEIKNFPGLSLIPEFHKALGQYINYRTALNDEDPERALFLAVPLETYQNFFSLLTVQANRTPRN